MLLCSLIDFHVDISVLLFLPPLPRQDEMEHKSLKQLEEMEDDIEEDLLEKYRCV